MHVYVYVQVDHDLKWSEEDGTAADPADSQRPSANSRKGNVVVALRVSVRELMVILKRSPSNGVHFPNAEYNDRFLDIICKNGVFMHRCDTLPLRVCVCDWI